MPEIKQDLRTATFIVAANDSVHKNMADYVCDGTNDEEELLAANNAAGTGTVQLLDGNFNIQANLTLTTLFRGLGKTATIFNVTDGVAFKLNCPGNLQDLTIKKPTGPGIALEIEVPSAGPNYMQTLRFLDGVFIQNTAGDVSGMGLYLHTTATAVQRFISMCQFGSIEIHGFEYGLKIYAECSNANSFINGCIWQALVLYNNKYMIYASTNTTGTGTPSASGNQFMDVVIQPTASTVGGITSDSRCAYSYYHITVADWSLATGSLLKFAKPNYVTGYPLIDYSMIQARSEIVDDFLSGTSEAGEIGELGWIFGAGTTPIVGQTTGNHPGYISIATTNTINNITYLCPVASNANLVLQGTVHEMTFIIKLVHNTDVIFFFGEMDDFSATPGNQDRAGFEFNSGTDVNWMLCTGDGAASTRTDSGIVVATATWYRLTVRRVGAGFDFYIDGVYVGRNTANLPDTFLNYGCHSQTLAAANKAFDIDYFKLVHEEVTR